MERQPAEQNAETHITEEKCEIEILPWHIADVIGISASGLPEKTVTSQKKGIRCSAPVSLAEIRDKLVFQIELAGIRKRVNAETGSGNPVFSSLHINQQHHSVACSVESITVIVKKIIGICHDGRVSTQPADKNNSSIAGIRPADFLGFFCQRRDFGGREDTGIVYNQRQLSGLAFRESSL